MDPATFIGVDVGGTRIKAVALNGERVSGHLAIASPPDLAARFAEVVQHVVEAVSAGAGPPPRAVGVVVPGLVDDATGMATWSANLGWRDLDVPGLVSARLKTAVVGGHDVRAGLLAEQRLGAARGVDDVLFIPLGTGLASALMVAGRIVSGTPWTGEIGHVRVVPDGPRCGCGRSGCLEAIASAGAIGRRWQDATGQEGDAELVAARVRTRDPVATALWGEAIDALATACAPIVTAAGTRRVVLGGGLAQAGCVLLDPFHGALADRLPADARVEVVAASLGEWAGAIGAACLAQGARS